MDFDALPEVPQDEFDLVGQLYPESAWMFVWARRVLRAFLGDGASPFLVGSLEPGSWSVLRPEQAWAAVRCEDAELPAAPSHAVSFASAQDAVAYAVAGVIVDADVTLHAYFLRDLGLLENPWRSADRPIVWELTDRGRQMIDAAPDDGLPGYRDSGVVLDPILDRPVTYQVLERVPRPAAGAFISAHETFRLHVLERLPGRFAASTGEELAEGTLLDSYATADEPYLFSLTTPFERRGLPRTISSFSRKLFVVRRPLRVYPGFPVESTTVPARGMHAVREPSTGGQGYLLPAPVSRMVAVGDIERITEAEAVRIHRAQRERQAARSAEETGR